MTWQTVYLRTLGIKPTREAIARLDQWQKWEGGHTNNTARFNFLNTKFKMPGSYDAIGNGVQGYRALGQGALAFAKTLRGRSDYAPLVEWLRSGQGDPSAALQVWVSGNPSGDPSYAQKVLGGKLTQTPPADTSAPETAPQPALGLGDVRATAAEGFAAIAQGRAKPEDTFSTLIATIRSAGQQMPQGGPQIPQVDITPGLKGVEAKAARLVQKYVGVNYVWGGTTPQGFDCSGLVQYVYRSLGVNIPRTTYQQWDAGTPVDVKNLKPGDAVFFAGSDPRGGKPGHEGMYLGNGLFIEAPRTGEQVRVSKLASRQDFVGARRFT